MPYANLPAGENQKKYTVLPQDEYIFQCIRSEEQYATTERPFFNLWLKVAQGQYKGQMVFDKLFFGEGKNEKATQVLLNRQKHVCEAFGLDVSVARDVKAEEFQDRFVRATVIRVSYEDKDGNLVEKNEVEMFGYSSASDFDEGPEVEPEPVDPEAPAQPQNQDVPSEEVPY